MRYHIDKNLDEKICGLFTAKEWVIGYENIILRQASKSSVQAFSDCQILELPFDSVQCFLTHEIATQQMKLKWDTIPTIQIEMISQEQYHLN